MKNLIKGTKGFSIAEVLVALGIGAVGVLAVSDLVVKNSSSQKGMQESMELSQFELEMRGYINNPDFIGNILGRGYKTPALAALANNFNPNSNAEQDVVLRNTADGGAANPLYQIWPIANFNAAPQNAKIGQNYLITRIYLQKKPGTEGNLLAGTNYRACYGCGTGTTGEEVVRRAIAAKLFMDLVYIPGLRLNPQEVRTVKKSFDIVFTVETRDALTNATGLPPSDGIEDDTVAFPWKIATVSEPVGSGANLGYVPAAIPGNAPPGCVTVASAPNGPAACPPGMYVMSQRPDYTLNFPCPPCMKGTCCAVRNEFIVTNALCCPVAR